MRKLLVCMLGALGLFAEEYNFAPKIENSGLEKKMVVCIPSYNNEGYCIKNLESVFAQKYTNFRVIFTDDASTDKTWELVQAYVKENNLEDRIALYHNEKNLKPMVNWYNMIVSCDDDEIIIQLDGDDWFAHDEVLKRVNQAYQDDRVWMTYGECVDFPETNDKHSEPMKFSRLKNGLFKQRGFRWAHLRTFYSGLFKQIPIDRFQYRNGSFFTQAVDVPIMLNLIYLAREHTFYIPDVLVVYNMENPLNEAKTVGNEHNPINLVFKRPWLRPAESWRTSN